MKVRTLIFTVVFLPLYLLAPVLGLPHARNIPQWLDRTAGAGGSALVLIWQYGGIALHVFTIYFAYRHGGIIVSAVSLGTPIFAELFWLFRGHGFLYDYFVVSVVAWASSYLLCIACFLIAPKAHARLLNNLAH